MKMNSISRKLIKPHTPTPANLKNYYVSVVDRYMLMMHFAVILFNESKPRNCIEQLEESLAKILVEFYPLAGRCMKNDHCVDCCDQGVEFVEAELAADNNVVVADVVAKADPGQLIHLLPDEYGVDEASRDPLMSIKATHFPCGGLAIAISVSHRVFDAASLGTFVAAWSSATNRDHGYEKITPSFDLPPLLPYEKSDFGVSLNRFKPFSHGTQDEIVVKRLVFDKAALTSLKSKIRLTNDRKNVSDVRIVCAVIAKALIGMDRVRGRNRDVVILQPVNMRERTIPAPPKHACGNLSMTSLTPRVAAAASQEIGMLVGLIGDALRKTITDHAKILSPEIDGSGIIKNTFEKFIGEFLNPETNIIVFTDWTKFGFYEADFGFGKPLWTSIDPKPRPRSNSTVLMSNKEGDGIEAWLQINKNDVSYFDQDQEIKLIVGNLAI